jgi:hypothetical protein
MMRQMLIDGRPRPVVFLNGVSYADELGYRDILDEWEDSERRHRLRERLREQDGVDADDVICPPERAHAKGMTSTVCFPAGNLAPNGSVIKSTAIDRGSLDPEGVLRMTGHARVFTRERDVIAALKGQEGEPVVEGEVIVLAGRGPLGSGMEETYQVTSFLRYLPTGRGSPSSPTHGSRGLDRAVHRARQPGGARGRADRQGRRRRRRPDRRRHAEPGGVGRAGRPRRRGVDGGGGGGSAGGTSDEPGDPAGRCPTGRHGALGAPAVGQRRPVGRVRLRRGVDRRRARCRCGGHAGDG